MKLTKFSPEVAAMLIDIPRRQALYEARYGKLQPGEQVDERLAAALLENCNEPEGKAKP